jgi:hypothetical protein
MAAPEEALAMEGVACTHLGYEVLVKRKVDELLVWECLPTDVSTDKDHTEMAVT